MKLRFTPFQAAVHIGAWLPLAWLAWAYATNHLTVNPIQAATQKTGIFAITLLLLSLACTPLNTLFGWRSVLKVRRALGLYACMYVGFHLFILLGIDYGFALDMAWADLSGKPYIFVGLATLLILVPLAVTSTKGWMRRLGKNWKRLHQLIYLAGLLAVVHYAWAKKGDLFSLRGDITQPLLYGGIVIILLIMRIPVVRRMVTRLRGAVGRAISEDRVKPVIHAPREGSPDVAIPRGPDQ